VTILKFLISDNHFATELKNTKNNSA